jgi:hypothetical protein
MSVSNEKVLHRTWDSIAYTLQNTYNYEPNGFLALLYHTLLHHFGNARIQSLLL